MTLLTQAEYARRCGVSRQAVGQWKGNGRLVLQGSQVDAEASDAALKHYRRNAMPTSLTDGGPVKRGRMDANVPVQLDTVPVRLPCAEVLRRLTALDWTPAFAWTDTAQDQRARLAAICVGLTACSSPVIDDGHWGGYQLRYTSDAADALNRDDIAAGFGFECDAWDLLVRCWAELEPVGEGDEVTVRLDLLHLLAHPFSEHDKRALDGVTQPRAVA